MRSRFFFLCLVIFFTWSFGFKANAASPNSILVDVSPENPTPYEDVNISIDSYANNLNSVLISWSVNGKKVLAGIGEKTLSLKAGAAGSTSTITATISLPDGTIEKRIIIKPNSMVLLWQANDSYVPPFYRGKAMPSIGSDIKVVAMPDVSNSKNMVYTWQKDYTKDTDGSGYGKNFFIFSNDYLENSNTITATAETVDQKYSSSASVNISATQPQIVFYRRDPKQGILWDMAVTDGYRVTDNTTIQAAPYFISPKQILHPDLVFNWFINDYQISVPELSKDLMPLRVQTGTSGTSNLKLQIDNLSKIFESAEKTISLEF